MTLHLLMVVMMAVSVPAIMGQSPTPQPVCTPVQLGQGGAIPPIILDREFTVKIEVVSGETSRVINMVMYYSQVKSQIRLTVFGNGTKYDQYYYFNDNEILTFENTQFRGAICTVDNDLQHSADTYVVGGSKDGDIPSPLGVLHYVGDDGFGNEIEKLYLGNETKVREIPAEALYSCQKWTFGSQSAILNVTHYFAADSSWNRPNTARVPLMIELHGSIILHGIERTMDHYYNFFDYKPSVQPTDLETPPGVLCEGRNNDKPFPKLPKFLKMSGEQINNFDTMSVSYFEELYDVDDQILMMTSVTEGENSPMNGNLHIRRIRDYITGLSYTISNEISCRIENITASEAMPFDSVDSNGRPQAQETSPEKLFNADKVKFAYLGERTVRGLVTDTWVGKTNIFTYPGTDVVVEWYFAKSGVKSWNDGSEYYQNNKFQLPVMFRIWPSGPTLSVDINIYHVDFTKVMFGAINLRVCYPETASNFVQILLPGAKEHLVNSNTDQFKWQAAMNLADAARIRWLRISDVQLSFTETDAIMEFEILDAPPQSSDSPMGQVNFQNLTQATERLKQNVLDGNLIIHAWDSTSQSLTKELKVSKSIMIGEQKFSAKSDSSEGYSSGAFAGLGVAMLVVGTGGGGFGAYRYLK